MRGKSQVSNRFEGYAQRLENKAQIGRHTLNRAQLDITQSVLRAYAAC